MYSHLNHSYLGQQPSIRQRSKGLRALRSSVSAATALIALATAATAQTTIYVDDDDAADPSPGVSGVGFPFSNPAEDGSIDRPFDDIQKAVDAAQNGDRVLVMPSNHFGVYSLSSTFGSLDLLGKSITVESADGPSVTRISGANLPSEPGVFIGGGGPDTVFRGFTIEACDHGDSNGDSGGGLRIQNASPTIEDCVFVGNRAFQGGGAHMTGSSAVFRDCVFVGNDASHQGGGIHVDRCDPKFYGCTFTSNSADYAGAFMTRTAAGILVTVSDCLFEENSSRVSYGGALAKFDLGDILVERCRFLRNSAAGMGGGSFIHGAAQFRSCLYDSNESLTARGGGITTGSTGGTVTVYGCTLHRNVGGGIFEEDPATPTVTEVRNSIVWGNGGFEIGTLVDVKYCNVLGGYGGEGNIDVDPMFANTLGVDGLAGTLDDDMTLLPASGCIDAGDTRVFDSDYPMDLAGNNRAVNHPRADTGIALVGQVVDMGAFELGSGCVRVRGTVTLSTSMP